MKALVLPVLLLAFGSLQAQQFELHEAEKSRFLAMLNTTSTANPGSNASPNFNVRHYRLEWEIDPAIRYIKGRITSSFTMTQPGTSIRFDLSDSLRVDSIIFRASGIPFTRPGTNTVEMTFPTSLSAGTQDSVIIYYQGIPPRTGFGSFAVANHTGVPIIWTLSEPYGSRDWWPCRNGLDDKADSIDVILRTPERFFGTTNGVQTGELVGGGKRTTVWKHQYPIATYLVAIAATNYEVQQDTIQLNGKILPLQQYVYPEASAAWKASVNSTRRMMRLFEQMFGPYPFRNERYAHTQVGFGGGMEHQTNSWMGNTSDQLIAHELAHQWFGNRVTCGSWQDIWLNEGFAVLLTYLNYETVLPRQQMVDWYTSEISIITYLPDGKVYVEDTTSVDRLFDYRLTYIKAAWVLQMLRWKLGDQKFSEASRNYLADTDLSYGFARTEDLKRVFEESSGMDLDGFFADWVYGEGHPSYQLQWKPIGAKVQYTLGQTTSHPSVDFFEMPVPILFRGQGKDTLVVIDHQVNGQSGLLDLGFTPDNAIIDPYVKLVSADNTVNRSGSGSITNSIKVYPNPIGDQFSILLENFNITSADLMVYNAAGQLVLRRTLSLPGGSDLVTIPSAGWARGVYIIRISNAEVNFTKRIMK